MNILIFLFLLIIFLYLLTYFKLKEHIKEKNKMYLNFIESNLKILNEMKIINTCLLKLTEKVETSTQNNTMIPNLSNNEILDEWLNGGGNSE